MYHYCILFSLLQGESRQGDLLSPNILIVCAERERERERVYNTLKTVAKNENELRGITTTLLRL